MRRMHTEKERLAQVDELTIDERGDFVQLKKIGFQGRQTGSGRLIGCISR